MNETAKKPNFFGTICSNVDRTNEVVIRLTEFGVCHLIPYILVDAKLKAFVYRAGLGRKKLIYVVEIYHDWNPRSVEWRRRNAQFALWLDEDLIDGLDYGVAVTDLVLPFGPTAVEEAVLNHLN